MIRETSLQSRIANTRIAALAICMTIALGIVGAISQVACRNNDKTMVTVSLDVSERDRLDDEFEQDVRNVGDEALYDLGVKLYDAAENRRSVTVFKECIRRGVKPDESSFKLGVALIGLGSTNEGVEAFKQAVKANPNHVKAHFNL